MSESNQGIYRQQDVVRFYAGYEVEDPAEQRWLTDYASELAGDVVDLGIGAGRSTALLAPLAASYIGIDYSPELVGAARERFPDLDLRVGDARSLTDIDDASADVVVFTFNGIDYADHEGRLQILAEVHRILRSGGLFLFSGHNRDLRGFDKVAFRDFYRSGRPVLSELRRAARLSARHRRMKRSNTHTADHAIVNDAGHDFTLLTYYIGEREQHAQLQAAGFSVEQTLTTAGRESAGTSTESPYLYYAARAVG